MKRFLQGQFRRRVGSTFITQLAGLMFSVTTAAIVARWLGPAGKGMLAAALLVPGIMVIFLNSGIGVANVYFAGARRLDISLLEGNSVSFAFMGTTLGSSILVGLFATGWLESLIPQVPERLIILAMLLLPFGLLSSYFSTLLQGMGRIVAINIVNLSQSAAILGFTFVLVVLFKTSVIGAVSAYLIANLLSLTMLGMLLRQEGGKFRSRWNPDIMRSTLSFGLRGYIGNLLQFLNYRIDMLLVNYFLGPANLGIYSVSVIFAELLWQLPSAIQFVLLPTAASANPKYLNVLTPKLLRITLLLTFFGAICLVVVGKYIITLIYGTQFVSSYHPLVILLPGVVGLSGAKVLASELIGRGYPHYNSLSAGMTAIITIPLNLWLIPKIGISGAALTSSVAYLCNFILTLMWHSRVSGLRVWMYARN
jgi:O-antigen/teichoic acid export membrane protein